MFYERLLHLCNERHTKITPLLQKINISTGNISKWKNGVLPQGETLIKIANYFNVSLDYLVGRTDKPEVNK